MRSLKSNQNIVQKDYSGYFPRLNLAECIVDGCGKKTHAKSLCRIHYRAKMRLAEGMKPLKYKQRENNMSLAQFCRWALAETTPNDKGCLEWKRCLNKGGYARALFNGEARLVGQLILEHYAGPSKLIQLHSCDNPKCINPEHLRWGTHKQNQEDSIIRDRSGLKLKRKDIWQIRKLREMFFWEYKEIANLFNVSYDYVRHICGYRARKTA